MAEQTYPYDDDDRVSAPIVAEYLGVSTKTLSRWRTMTRQGKPRGPAWIKTGYKQSSYRWGDVLAYERQRRLK